MLPFEDRWTRQRQLGEVGRDGQDRLCAATVVVPRAPGAWAEVEYLKRAGVRVEPGATADADSFPHAQHFTTSAGVLAAGAWRALHAIRQILAQAPVTHERPQASNAGPQDLDAPAAGPPQ